MSSDPRRSFDVEECAEWIRGHLERIGLKHSRVIATGGAPVVYAVWLHAGAERPTVVIYDHYDVQPAEPPDSWQSPPFEATIRDDRLYARGAVDNKAGVWGNISVLNAPLSAQGDLPVNVKVLFEGEEESASPHLEALLDEHPEILDVDLVLNCDARFGATEPTATYAGRGIVAGEAIVRGPRADLHSGQYGGIVENPVHVACRIVAAVHDTQGRVRIPGFYDSVSPIDEEERALVGDGWEATRMESHAGVPVTWGNEIAPDPERATALPTFDVNGIWSGHHGAGVRTIIQSEARLKFSARIVHHQDPHVVARAVADFFESFATPRVTVEVTIEEHAWPFRLDPDGPYLDAVQRALECAVGRRAKLVRTLLFDVDCRLERDGA